MHELGLRDYDDGTAGVGGDGAVVVIPVGVLLARGGDIDVAEDLPELLGGGAAGGVESGRALEDDVTPPVGLGDED